jgi:hypothetical protein
MADAKRADDWDHTATLRADIRNTAFGSKGNAKAIDLNPYRMTRHAPRRLNREQGAKLLDAVFEGLQSAKR